MSTAIVNPAEQLIEFILTATTLTSEQKDLYVGALMEGKMHPELELNWTAICDHEIAATEQELQVLQEGKASLESAVKAQDAEIVAGSAPFIQEHEQELETAVSDFKQECSNIERSLDTSVEGDTRAQESSEADAIRKKLKGDK